MQISFSLLLAALLTVIWAATGLGYFWPIWAWLGLAILLALRVLALRARQAAGDPVAALRIKAELGALAAAVCWVVWALSGGGYLWPFWPMLGSATALAARALHVCTAELLASGEAGVGYLLKERVGDVRGFVEAVERVAAGGTALDREVVAELMRARTAGGREDGELASLTPREREVLELMAEGRSNAAVARALVVSGGAVEKHVRQIFAKLDLPASDDDHRRVLAVLAFLRAGAA